MSPRRRAARRDRYVWNLELQVGLLRLGQRVSAYNTVTREKSDAQLNGVAPVRCELHFTGVGLKRVGTGGSWGQPS